MSFLSINKKGGCNESQTTLNTVEPGLVLKILSVTALPLWMSVLGFTAFGASPPQRIEKSNYERDYRSEELIQKTQRMEQNYKLYGGGGTSFHDAQIFARGNFINRMNGYFAPRNVNIYDPNLLGRAIEYDQLRRREALNNLVTGVENQITNIEINQKKELGTVLDNSGRLSTYNVGVLKNAGAQLKYLAGETYRIESYIGTSFRSQYRERLSAPYLERTGIIERRDQADKVADFFLKGTGSGFKGIAGMRDSLYAGSYSLIGFARHIELRENEMRNNLAPKYIEGGVQVACGIVMLPISGGTSSIAIAKGAADAGMTLRQNIVLNEKGLEGFRSNAEDSAVKAYGEFQKGLAIAEVALNVASFAKTGINAGSELAKQGKSSSGFSLTGAQTYQWVAAGYQLADMTGLTSNFMDDQQRSVIRAAFAGGNMAAAGYNLKKMQSDLNSGSRGTIALKKGANATLTMEYLQLPSHILKSGTAIAQAWGNGRRWIEENGPVLRSASLGTRALAEAGTLYRNEVYRENYKNAEEEINRLFREKVIDKEGITTGFDIDRVLEERQIIKKTGHETVTAATPMNPNRAFPILLNIAANFNRPSPENRTESKSKPNLPALLPRERTETTITVGTKKEFKQLVKSGGNFELDQKNGAVQLSNGQNVKMTRYINSEYKTFSDPSGNYSKIVINELSMRKPGEWTSHPEIAVEKFKTDSGYISLHNGKIVAPESLSPEELRNWYLNLNKLR